MKRFLSCLLAVLLLFSLVPGVCAAAEPALSAGEAAAAEDRGRSMRLYTFSPSYESDEPTDPEGGSMGLAGNYEEFRWGSFLFETPSTALAAQSMGDRDSALYNLAMLCGALSINSYFPDYLVQAYRDLGAAEEDIFLYSYPEQEEYNRSRAMRNDVIFTLDSELAFSIASLPMDVDGVETDILFITARGTKNVVEVLNDGLMLAFRDFYGYIAWNYVWDFEEDIFAGLQDYYSAHPALGTRPVKIVLSGHSLGGAAANLAAARLDLELRSGDGSRYGSGLTEDDICCFTFGAIDSLINLQGIWNSLQNMLEWSETVSGRIGRILEKQPQFPIQNGFDNILNIYNLVDTFGPITQGITFNLGHALDMPEYRNFAFKANARGSTGFGKFGRLLTFADSMRENIRSRWPTHELLSYVRAIRRGAPSSDTDYSARIVVTSPVDLELVRNGLSICRIEAGELVHTAGRLAVSLEDRARVLLVPEGNQYRVDFSTQDGGIIDCYVLDLEGGHAVSWFSNISAEAGQSFSCVLQRYGSSSSVRLFVLDDSGNPAAEFLPDGTLSTEAPRRMAAAKAAVFLAAPVLALILLTITLVTRKKHRARKKAGA